MMNRKGAVEKVLFDQELPPMGEFVKVEIGPFRRDEDPKIDVRYENVYPEGSLSSDSTRLDDHGTYNIVYLFQNYGTKTARVIITRTY
jgi:hypothetical protein